MNQIVIGNVISFLGCLLMVSIGFLRTKKQILGVQCLQFSLMGVSNFLLGGISGTISNVVSVLRNLVFFKAKVTVPLKLGFIALQVLLSIGALRNSPLEWLPVLAAGALTWFLDVKNEVVLKVVIIATFFLWVVYDLCHLNYVAMTFDILSIFSNAAGIYMIRKAGRNA